MIAELGDLEKLAQHIVSNTLMSWASCYAKKDNRGNLKVQFVMC